jgi:hypothetical protein
MISIVGTLEAGEAQGTQRAIRVRMHGANFGPLIFVASLVIGAATGIGVAAFFFDIIRMPNLSLPAFVVAAALVTMGLNRLFREWSVKRFRRNMQVRNMPTNFSYSFSLADDQLILETQWVRKTAPWSSVTEIFRSGRYWIFLVGFDPWFAPSRFFSSAEEERNFIATAVNHLSSDARERSRDAVTFARP